jgi:hypothetical protein
MSEIKDILGIVVADKDGIIKSVVALMAVCHPV